MAISNAINNKYTIITDEFGINVFNKVRRLSQVKLFNAIVIRANKDYTWYANKKERSTIIKMCDTFGDVLYTSDILYNDIQFFLRMKILFKVDRQLYKVNEELVELLNTEQ